MIHREKSPRLNLALQWNHGIDMIEMENHFEMFFPLKHHLVISGWYTLWLFNIAMENGPFIDDFPS